MRRSAGQLIYRRFRHFRLAAAEAQEFPAQELNKRALESRLHQLLPSSPKHSSHGPLYAAATVPATGDLMQYIAGGAPACRLSNLPQLTLSMRQGETC